MLNVVKILNREEYKEEKLKTLQVIKNLLFKNYPIDEIQEITGSDIEKSYDSLIRSVDLYSCFP